MSEPFLAEVRMVGFNFPPRNWAFCDGQILPIAQNQALFALLGTTYGGDGRTTFSLPDLRGRTPAHVGANGIALGSKAGEETHALTTDEVPAHTHNIVASGNQGSDTSPVGNVLASQARRGQPIYAAANNLVGLNSNVSTSGGGSSHINMQPYLVISFCIALQGVFPSRN